MTELAIIPNYAKKTARFKGAIAAGERVAVTIQNDGGDVADVSNLRLRVVGIDGHTLAQFPMPESEDAWGTGQSLLQCTFNLNTVQMLRAVPPAATAPLLFVLDDAKNETLYFKDICEVTHWPRRVGEDEPVDLGKYADLMKEIDAWHEEHARGMETIERLDSAVISGGWAFYPESRGGDNKWHRLLIAQGCIAYERQGYDYKPTVDMFEVVSDVLYVGKAFRRVVRDGTLFLNAIQ